MNKLGKFGPLTLRIIGGVIGCIGFAISVIRPQAASTSVALIGLGTFIISLGGDK